MKTRTLSRCAAGGLLPAAVLLAPGCATSRLPPHCYLQREPIRVAVLPSINRTDHPEAPVVFNKACEEALRRHGFEVVSADQVVTYASARGIPLMELAGCKASEIGTDLKADMILYSDLDTWRTKYVVLKSATVVAGSSRLVEASTDGLVWSFAWRFQQESGNGGGGLLGAAIDATATAIAHSAFDTCSRLGERAASETVGTLPRPGFAPAANPP